MIVKLPIAISGAPEIRHVQQKIIVAKRKSLFSLVEEKITRQ